MIGQMLEQVDAITASETLRAGLLPRAPHVVPQLMKTLREENYSSADVASRISKDAVLTAEVVRSATSVFDNTGDGVEIDLARAVFMIGTQGLRRAIANVVLRPIFDARGDTLSARAATQIWKDADRKARLCAALAAQTDGVDPFDGYLAGLLHNSGWTAALRAIDGLAEISVSAADLAHGDVVPQLLARRDALFGAIVGPWNLSPAMDRAGRRDRRGRPRRGRVAARRRPCATPTGWRPARAAPRRARGPEPACRRGRCWPSRCATATPVSAPEAPV